MISEDSKLDYTIVIPLNQIKNTILWFFCFVINKFETHLTRLREINFKYKNNILNNLTPVILIY